MFCIVSAVILSILGIFSASNRQLAREALDCVFRRVTFRPCTTGFDEKMKAKLLGVVIMRSERAARALNRYFEPLSWVFFILLLASSMWFARGLYLFYTTGSCNGVNSSGFCVFDPTGANNEVSAVTEGCKVSDFTSDKKDLTLDGVTLADFPVLHAGAKDKIVFIGCYACDYTRKAYPMITQLADKYDAELTFAEYPTKLKSDYLARVSACVYEEAPDKLWTLNEALYGLEKDKLEDPAAIDAVLTAQGLDPNTVGFCAGNADTLEQTRSRLAEVEKTNFYGTPTIFINGKVFVGPKPYRVYAIALKGLFYWLR